MDQIRVLLWAALLAMLWLGFSQWTEDYGAPPPPPSVADDLPTVDEQTLPEATPLPSVTAESTLPQTATEPPSLRVI